MQRVEGCLVNTGSAPEPICQPLFAWLREAGAGLRVGQTVQFGSTLLKVAEASNGERALLAPRKGSMPVEWQDDLGGALITMAQQRYTADSLGLSPQLDFVSSMSPAAVCTKVHAASRLLFSREEPMENGVSWWVYCRDGDHDHDQPDALQLKSLYEIAITLAPFEIFWGLPVGIQLLLEKQKIQAQFRQEPVPIPGDSFLLQYLSSAPETARWR